MIRGRLEMAERLGAIPIDGGARNSSEAVKAETGGHGADRAIEAVELGESGLVTRARVYYEREQS
jgi:threonine dehydrogenase-like Zn-dependent dehydrogenase